MNRSQIYFRSALSLAFVVTFAACGKSSDSKSDGGGEKANANRVDWAQVPADFNPLIETSNLQTAGLDTVKLDMFGSDGDVVVVYSDSLPPGQAQLKTYRVFKKSASWGSVNVKTSGSTLEVRNSGTYQCSIRVENGRITQLEGGCYVRIEVVLPTGSQIEVYNRGSLITPRYKLMSAVDFLMAFDRATFSNQKFAVIDEFLSSYAAAGRQPVLVAVQLGEVLEDFIRKDEKLQALRKLHHTVADRKSLANVIDAKFSYFDQNEARAIAGLPPAHD